MHDFSQRADTSYVMVAATTLERLLEQTLLGNMRKISNTLFDDLFRGYGPLASFGAKIDIAYAFRIIDDDLVGDFRTIKAIRNAFAHSDEVLHFKSEKLASRFQRLTGWTKDCDELKLFDARIAACTEALNRLVDGQILVRALQAHTERRTSREKS